MNKKIIFGLCAGILISTASFAADFGVINILLINEKAKVMKSINGQKNEALEEIQDEVNAKRKDFEKQEEILKSKSALLNEEARPAFMQEVTDFQSSVMEFDKKTSTKVTAIEKAYVEGLKQIQLNYLDAIVKQVGNEREFDAVLNSQQTVVLNQSLDITQEVIEKLDEQVKEIELQIK